MTDLVKANIRTPSTVSPVIETRKRQQLLPDYNNQTLQKTSCLYLNVDIVLIGQPYFELFSTALVILLAVIDKTAMECFDFNVFILLKRLLNGSPGVFL